ELLGFFTLTKTQPERRSRARTATPVKTHTSAATERLSQSCHSVPTRSEDVFFAFEGPAGASAALRFCSGPHPGDRQPVVFLRMVEMEGRQRHDQKAAQRLSVRLVQS